MRNWMQKLLLIGCFVVLGGGFLAAQPNNRIKLTQLEQAPLISGSRKGMIGLSNAAGDQRYAFYVNVADTCITYTPTDTGNATVSIFVQKCGTDSIWYIDYEGRSILLAPFGGAGSCDVDWLNITDNSCPATLQDSLYKYNYAAIGARLVWPDAELLVSDSAAAGVQIISGQRQASLGLYDNLNELWATLAQEGGETNLYLLPGNDFILRTASGTPENPTAVTDHLGVHTADSTIQFYQYPNTRVDTATVLNFLYTDPSGVVQSKPVGSLPGIGNGIYGGSNDIPDNTIANVPTSQTFSFNVNDGSTVNIGDISNVWNGIGLNVTSTAVSIGDIYNVSGTYFINQGTGGNYLRSPASNLQQLTAVSGTAWNILGGPFKFIDDRGTKVGAVYGSAGYGAGFSDSTLIHRAYAAQMIADSIAAHPPGTGTVTSFSSGNLSPLFTTSVATATTTPALSFTLSNANANTVLAGPTSGGAAAPTYRALVAADIPSGAGGFLLDGGNTTGATVTAGTNDANALSLETNNVVRATVTGAASTGGAWTCTDVTANTNSIETATLNQVNSTGTAATGFGYRHEIQLESSTTDNQQAMTFDVQWQTATHATRTANLIIRGTNSGSSGGNFLTVGPSSPAGAPNLRIGNSLTTYADNAITIGTSFTLGGANALTLGGSSGGINLNTSSVAGNAIAFNLNDATGANGINVGNTGVHTNTSTARSVMQFTNVFQPTSGSAEYNFLALNGTVNETSSAAHPISSIKINPTITAVLGSYYALNIAVNSSSAYGIYQSGSSTKNYFTGNTGFGDATPETLLDVAGTAGVVHLIGQDNTPTITVDAAQAGTGASASMTNAQSSDLAGRFTITTGTGATTGRWASVSFGTSFSVTPIVQAYNEDPNSASTTHYVNVSTSGFEIFMNTIPGSPDSKTYSFNFVIVGGK